MDIKGYIVEKVLVAPKIQFNSELYIGITIDRNSKSAICMVSSEGGVEIEEVAKNTPQSIHTFVIDASIGMANFLARRIAFTLFSDINLAKQATDLLIKLYQIFIEKDASLIEINPLVITNEGKLLALDAKMNIDDNALFRQTQIVGMYEPTEDEKKEIQAKNAGLTYIRLDGNIGCMVNGAGLAMATMDVIKHFGGRPANFLDIGGSSHPQKVVDAKHLLLSDKHVQVILINIFGGITRCDDVARGLLIALDQLKVDIPIIIRLSGTNAEEGLRIIAEKNLPTVNSLSEGAQLAVQLVG